MSLVWYASYGSNMDLDRFMKYFNNEEFIVNDQTKRYDLCLDQANPISERSYIINRRFFFAKESGTWKITDVNGNETKYGVGFISKKIDKRSLTCAKLYKISKVQFKHLFEQENNGKACTIDYQILQRKKKQDFNNPNGREWFYSRILQLEDNYKGSPILTFTTQNFLNKNSPMDQYVQLISAGIKATHGLSDEEIAKYMRKAKRK